MFGSGSQQDDNSALSAFRVCTSNAGVGAISW